MSSASGSSTTSRPRRRNLTSTPEHALLANHVRSLLLGKPEGMCGGLVTQRLKEVATHEIEVLYGETKEDQKGWLQDLMRVLPGVQIQKEGRDNWYSIDPDAVMPEVSTGSTNCLSTGSGGSQEVDFQSCAQEEEDEADPTSCISVLRRRVRSLLRETPEGMSGSTIGVRLRTLEPAAVEALYAEKKKCAGSPLNDLVLTMTDVTAQKRGLSTVYVIDGCSGAGYSRSSTPLSTPPTSATPSPDLRRNLGPNDPNSPYSPPIPEAEVARWDLGASGSFSPPESQSRPSLGRRAGGPAGTGPGSGRQAPSSRNGSSSGRFGAQPLWAEAARAMRKGTWTDVMNAVKRDVARAMTENGACGRCRRRLVK